MHITTRKLAAAAVTGAAYAALTMLLAPISYGAIQCRVSEVLCILPFFIPCTAWGLFVGCAIANLLSAAGIFDVVFGSLATLLAALCTAWLGRGRGAQSWLRCVLAALMPVVFNFVFVGAVLTWSLTDAVFPHLNASFWLFGGQVGSAKSPCSAFWACRSCACCRATRSSGRSFAAIKRSDGA